MPKNQKNPEGPLEILVHLMDQHNRLVEALERLNKMRGYDTAGESLCTSVEFQTPYGAAMHSYAHDPQFNQHMVETAIEYMTARLTNTGFLLGLAERTVNAEMGDKLREMLHNMQQKGKQ